jgi:hypothetical protein
MKYAQYDEKGRITGFYTQGLNGGLPENAIEISDEEWLECLNDQTRWRVNPVTKGLEADDYSPLAAEKQLNTVIRPQRDKLLTASDWTQLLDNGLSRAKRKEWAIYRRNLRNFPEVCDPFDPVWPEPPGR